MTDIVSATDTIPPSTFATNGKLGHASGFVLRGYSAQASASGAVPDELSRYILALCVLSGVW